MGFPGLSPFGAAAPFNATGFASPQAQGGCPSCAPAAGACPSCAPAGGQPGAQSPVFPGMTGAPAGSMQSDPLAQMGMQSMTPDTQALFMQITTMMVGVMGLIAGLLAGILSGAISGKAPAGANNNALATSANTPGGGGNTPGGGTAPTGSTGGVVADPKKTPNGTFTLPLPDQKFFKGRSPFGAPRAGHTHAGNDFFAPAGTPVLSVAEGEIISAVPTEDGNTAGIRVAIRHPNGDTSHYYHLREISINPATGKPFKAGDKVPIGQQIGTVGNTGNARTTPAHLHFEIKPNGGAAVDPWTYFIRNLLPAGFG